ncbi:glycosyltransferase family 4 protein [Neobacillus sp. YIM B06451]|uniref:glycosyltransferase family 4 protein n=1 Tax=Neobacillus sp. YIM B06451 TaxID=3070994 RepID=UPI0029319363|nr:glycosyltransferase family 4 protein [Neobacillus sp. YIM B06451]
MAAIKILMLADHLVQGGLETHVVTLVNELTKLGHEIFLFTASISPQILSQITPSKFTYLNWSDGSFKKIEKFKPDIIHSHPFTAIDKGREFAIHFKKPLIVTMHGIYDFGVDDSPLGYEVSKVLKRIIAVDFRVALYLLSNAYQPEKISVIRNGIDFQKFYPKAGDRSLISSLGLNPANFTLSVVSRFDDDKEVPIIQLLKCTPLLSKFVEGINLLVIGDGGKLNEVKKAIPQKVPSNIKIKLLGWQENIEDFYRISDLVMGSGRVALEALSCKIPVYAMWDGFGGVITKDNHDLIMMGGAFRQLSDGELINELVKVVNQRSFLQQSARESYEFVTKAYDSRIITEQLVRIYEQYRQ